MKAEGEVVVFPVERVETGLNFDEFFEDEHERLFKALYFVTGSRQDAEELMQDAFMKLWERWDQIGRISDPTGYVFRVALNGFRMRRLSSLLIDGPYRCEDGTEGTTGPGVGWGGNGGPVLSDQHLDVSENWQVIAFMVSGRLGSRGGSGSLTFLLPGLTADEQAQVCTMGELT